MKRKHSMSEENFDSIMAKAQETGEISKAIEPSNNEMKQESDKDSDYGGSDYDTGEATTFRMLFERTQASDIEFVDCCQQVGLISASQTCDCGSLMSMCHSECPDGVDWKCPSCNKIRSLREGSWLDEFKRIRLKEIILVLYCWARNYPESLCQHEIDLTEESLLFIPFTYKKCKKLCSEFFKDEISNIGNVNEIVDIQEFVTTEGVHVLGGVERTNVKNSFFTLLPETWNRDDICTAIVDNITSGSIIHCHSRSIIEVLQPIGVRYLEKAWNLKLQDDVNSEDSIVSSIWSSCERLLTNKDNLGNQLDEILFRRRMEVHRDPFLFLLNVLALIHPPPSTPLKNVQNNQ